MANVDIDLGQHELIADVLSVDARVVVAQYVASVYTTTPLEKRAKAVDDAIQRVAAFASIGSPIADMEGASAAGRSTSSDGGLQRMTGRMTTNAGSAKRCFD